MELAVKKSGLFGLVLWIMYTAIIADEAEDGRDLYSRSIANFLRIKDELKNSQSKPAAENVLQDVDRRASVLNPAHEGWTGHFFHHLKTQNVPEFGHDEIHSMDEQGVKFHLDSSPRHHVHHGHHHHFPHYHHEVHTFHYDGEHPHINHEHFVHYEPAHEHMPFMHHIGHQFVQPDGHHIGHHDGHHFDDEESGDHEEHHEDEAMHGDTEDWDVGGGYFQLEEHGSDVNVVALKKHGTKVHMSGGDFNVIRDPWRHHSLFAGLFHPHEMPGHGHFPMEQFHQHFTYIANDRAINHHVYEHHLHNENNHIHEHDPGHEFDYFYHHPPEPNNHGGKREYMGNGSVNITAKAQVKHEISSPLGVTGDIITIPLSFSARNQQPLETRSGSSIVPLQLSDSDSFVKPQMVPPATDVVESNGEDVVHSRNSLPVIEVFNSTEMFKLKAVKKKEELPKGKSPHLSPFNGNRIGPKYAGKSVEMPFAPLFKRDISGLFTIAHSQGDTESRNLDHDSSQSTHSGRSSRLRKAFLGKLLLAKNAS